MKTIHVRDGLLFRNHVLEACIVVTELATTEILRFLSTLHSFHFSNMIGFVLTRNYTPFEYKPPSPLTFCKNLLQRYIYLQLKPPCPFAARSTRSFTSQITFNGLPEPNLQVDPVHSNTWCSNAGGPSLQHAMLITGAHVLLVSYDTQPSTPRLSLVPRLLFTEGENSLVNCLYHLGSNIYAVW